MALISTRVHGAADYATGAGLLAGPTVLRLPEGSLAAGALRGAGAAILGLTAVSDHELGLRRWVPMPVHLIADAASGALLGAGAVVLRRRGGGPLTWIPHAVVGAGEIVAAALTARQPGDRTAEAAPPSTPEAAAGGAEPAPQSPEATEPAPQSPEAAAGGAKPAPVSTPEATAPAAKPREPAVADQSLDPLVAREESAAAAAARRIGGLGPDSVGDPAMDPVYQAGGGEQEGWEEAEALLIENATHGEGSADPEHDAFTPETETDRSTAAFGEPDSIRSTEVPDERASDAQENPPDGPDVSG